MCLDELHGRTEHWYSAHSSIYPYSCSGSVSLISRPVSWSLFGVFLETSKHKQKNSKSPFYSNSICSPIQPSLPSCSSQADLLSQSPLVAVSDFSPLLQVLPLPLSPLDLQIALAWSFLRTSSPSPHELLPYLSFPSECTGIFAHLFFPSISDEEWPLSPLRRIPPWVSALIPSNNFDP